MQRSASGPRLLLSRGETRLCYETILFISKLSSTVERVFRLILIILKGEHDASHSNDSLTYKLNADVVI